MTWLAAIAIAVAVAISPDVARGFAAGSTWFIDPDSNAARAEARMRALGNTDDAEAFHVLATASQADWFGGWSGPIRAAVAQRLSQIEAQQALPVFVAYNVPGRDCSGYSSGGANTADEYRDWIDDFASALGEQRAVVILEPDSLALTECLPPDRLAERYALINAALQRLVQQPGVAVYLDGGHSAWHAADDQAARLTRAGVGGAQGFFLNVSNFQRTDDELAYGSALSGLVSWKHFVIDTSRNGNGPWQSAEPETWCNPPGRALGPGPTLATGQPLADAFLWIKRPGENDGSCRSGPAAGAWYPEYALALVRNR
ncbi:MAG TPA: glycoside hydrolase family 6 protein [Chloroflexota bacterium]|jgi:endoglucanase